MGITTVLAVSLLTIVPAQAQTAGDKAVEPARAPETERVKADGIEDLLADGKVFFLDVECAKCDTEYRDIMGVRN